MAKRPDWQIKDPAFTNIRYWSSAATCGNSGAGNWVDNNSVTNANFVRDSGIRTYAITPNFNKGERQSPVLPLDYTATYEKQRAEFSQRQYSQRVLNCVIGNTSYQIPYTYQDSTTYSHNVLTLGFGVGEYDIAAVERQATDKLLDNIKDMKVNVVQAFAERQQTVDTVVNAMRSVAGALSNLKKGNFPGAAKALGLTKPPKRAARRFKEEAKSNLSQAAANGWLSLQYGWGPLLQDVHGAAEILAQARTGENRNAVYVRTFGKRKKSLEFRQLQNNAVSDWTGYDTTVRYTDGFYLVRYGVTYVRSSPPVQALSKLGISNPALIAWELAPFSFVVDWFLPIGNWLGGLDATAGLSFHSGYKTTLYKVNQTASRSQLITSKDGRQTSSTTIQESREYTRMTRTTLSGFPSAPAPRFKNPVSMSHLTSAMSLLRQLKR
jgi:hypothetical protein